MSDISQLSVALRLPPYTRRSKSLEVLIPILYLKGISTGDFEEALIEDTRPALLGAQDRQCLEQAAQEPAIEGQACAPGDLDGRDQEGCTSNTTRLSSA
jgi:hypothetical protein